MPCDAMNVAKYRLAKIKQEIEVYVHSDHDNPGRYEYGIKGPSVREGIKGSADDLYEATKKAVKIAIASHTEMLGNRKDPGDIEWGTIDFPGGRMTVEADEKGDVRIHGIVMEGAKATRAPEAARAATMGELSKALKVEPVAPVAPSRWALR